MNFQGETRLQFSPRSWAAASWGYPSWRNLFTGASQQLMVIHVTGPVGNPEIRKEAFPGVNQALEQLQERSSPERR